jgi:16S rRNA (guanine527-N7)-methyltransferase
VFGDSLELAQRYAAILATDGVVRGLIGPKEPSRLWERHLLNCAVVADLVPESGELIDIGSGAGLPGLILAMLRPRMRITLVEPMLRRTAFLAECIGALELVNVSVIRARAEEIAGTVQADIATARAVAPLDRLTGLAAGVLRPGGSLLAIKGEGAEAELAAARRGFGRLGVRSAKVLRVGHDRVNPATTVVRVVIGPRGREEQIGARGSRPGMA